MGTSETCHFRRREMRAASFDLSQRRALRDMVDGFQ
jgi:hypothetical protein